MTDEHRELRTEEIPIDEYLEIPDILGGQEGDYILQVNGASFEGLAILEGDYLVVRPIAEPERGVVAVAVQGEGDPPSTILGTAEELPAGANPCDRLIGVIRKV